MKYVDEFRDPSRVAAWTRALHSIPLEPSRSVQIMEVCGGQTRSILRFGIDALLPPQVSLIHGPGCPVCVTPVESLDQAITVVASPEVILCTYGDMLRVPGSAATLAEAGARHGNVRIVSRTMDLIPWALAEPQRYVVFLAVGFETTAPATAALVLALQSLHLKNVGILMAHVRLIPVLDMILRDSEAKVDGLLAPGHVCTVTGLHDYSSLAASYKRPIVVTGFEPVDLLRGLHRSLLRVSRGEYGLDNDYSRFVTTKGATSAQAMMASVMRPRDMPWRGLGLIPGGGYELRPEFRAYDAAHRLGLQGQVSRERLEPPVCYGGDVLRGRLSPRDCPHFGRTCTRAHPLGAPMVSEEGACAAYSMFAPHSSTTRSQRGDT